MDGAGVRYQTIYDVVQQIPRGCVATYGQIAKLVGCGARQVGYAMATLPLGSDVPWHRVVNAQGRVSPRTDGPGAVVQRTMLEEEGLAFGDKDALDLARYGWEGPDWSWLHDRGLHPISWISGGRPSLPDR